MLVFLATLDPSFGGVLVYTDVEGPDLGRWDAGPSYSGLTARTGRSRRANCGSTTDAGGCRYTIPPVGVGAPSSSSARAGQEWVDSGTRMDDRFRTLAGNNVSGVMQTVNVGTGWAVRASNGVTKTCWSEDKSLGLPSSTLNGSLNGSAVSGTSPWPLTFDNTSTEDPVTWSWDFGDGSRSTEQNPTRTFSHGGTQTVTDVTGHSDTTRRLDYILVGPQAPSISAGASKTADSGAATAQVSLARPPGTTVGMS